jgi:hypothetical protein
MDGRRFVDEAGCRNLRDICLYEAFYADAKGAISEEQSISGIMANLDELLGTFQIHKIVTLSGIRCWRP